jgi:hypothetical protein
MSDAGAATTEPKPVPAEIDRWNWGAFFLNWIWGVGNNTYIALLTFIPIVGLVMLFVLGAKGSKWAWRNGRWDSVEHFKSVQRKWALWGLVVWIAGALMFAGIFGGTFYGMKHSEAYALGVSKLEASPAAVAALGTPITTGFPFGKIETQGGGTGEAVLSFSASGPKASGTVYLAAIKNGGVWSIKGLALKIDGGHSAPINIVGGRDNST